MEYAKLGSTELVVSRICLGGMSFGNPQKGFLRWVLDEDAARPIIKRALELGINFIDTANVYAEGTSEEIIGKALKNYAKREQVVIATKVNPLSGGGLSRESIMREIDLSLKRLQTDYVDLYQIHRWDYQTPIEETMEALHDLVKAGKVRYIGASSMWTWQFQKAQYVADKNGWTRFVTMQNHLNLIYREEEREMLPYCREENIAVIPYSPLAGGRLAREASTPREELDHVVRQKYDATAEQDRKVIERVAELARKRGVRQAHIALAWLLQKEPVTAAIVGATKTSQLDDAAKALDITLTPEEVAFLEEPYVPHPVVGHF
jgi:aryl-alcohol dehydrogenase-like predicted oxidoreductase